MTMRLPIRLAVFACVLAANVAPATDLPVPTVEYSADRVLETDAGIFEGRIYSAKGKERIETSMQGIESVMILRRDLQAGWMLMPAQRMYQELELGRAEEQAGLQSSDKADISVVGPETIEGRATTKYKMVMKDGSGGGFVWITEDGITVKMDLLGKDGRDRTRMTVTLTNIVIGAQNPALFELPEGYTAMRSFGAFGKPGGLRDAAGRIFNR
jgi:hypothetical protein